MLHKYFLEIIPGTARYVLAELAEKHPLAKIITQSSHLIALESDTADVDAFRNMLSVLRVSKLGGPSRNLFRRDWRVEHVAAGINPALAFILCQVAAIKPTDIVIDPFCGGGTIAVTAALYFSPAKVLASDISGTAIDKTVANFLAAQIKKDRYTTFRTNVSGLHLQAGSINKLVTNLPFGVRTGDHEQNRISYRVLAKKMGTALAANGRMVIFTQEKKLLLESFTNFNLIDSFDVDQGGLKPRVFVYTH